MRKTTSRRTTALGHALTLTQQAPVVAARRLAQLSTANPVRASAMLAEMISEKTFVFAQAYASSFMAFGQAQLSMMRMAMAPTMSTDLLRSGSEIARASLAPLAKRVRRNSK